MAVVGLGKKDAGVCGAENWDTSKESIRQAVSGKTRHSARLSAGYMEEFGVSSWMISVYFSVHVQLAAGYFRTWR